MVSVAQAKVNHFEVQLLIEQEVLGFHVAVDNAELAEIVEG